MKADEGQAVCLRVAVARYPSRVSGADIKIASISLAVDLLGKNVANHPSNHGFFF